MVCKTRVSRDLVLIVLSVIRKPSPPPSSTRPAATAGVVDVVAITISVAAGVVGAAEIRSVLFNVASVL
ncbi:hypothetical protein BDM02DRAFT_3110711 [Thelephora ganbajun]|uniref:Uncharacterized protein n=1 Tax=Thelephora ganbajun TaxID=370292 RepID=A0ACB6ZQ44_THEGA|nr:hypothetical protein BDM02DRAFT_3110711 [Thelephora ganbajun]